MADWDSALLVEEPLPALPTSTERNQCTEVLSTLMLFGQAEVVWKDAIRLFKTRREHHIKNGTWSRVCAEYQRLLAQGSSGGTMSDAPKRLRTDSGAQTPPSPSGLPSGAPASRGQRVPEGHGQRPGPPPPTSSNQPAGPPPPTGAYGGVNVDPNQPANPLGVAWDRSSTSTHGVPTAATPSPVPTSVRPAPGPPATAGRRAAGVPPPVADDPRVPAGDVRGPARRAPGPVPRVRLVPGTTVEFPDDINDLASWGQNLITFGKLAKKENTYEELLLMTSKDMVSYKKWILEHTSTGGVKLVDLAKYLEANRQLGFLPQAVPSSPTSTSSSGFQRVTRTP